MPDIYLDGEKIRSKDDFYGIMDDCLKDYAADILGPECRMGHSLDALYDVLTQLREETVIIIKNAGEMFARERAYYDRFMRMLRQAEEENRSLSHRIAESGAESSSESEESEKADSTKSGMNSDEGLCMKSGGNYDVKGGAEPEMKSDTKSNIMSTTEKGYGKINLSLDVTGKLENGYHLVKMVMASVSIYDELTFTRSENPGIRLNWAGDDGKNLSLGEDNLIMKAARAILSTDGINKNITGTDTGDLPGLDITLKKNIPMAAGMAGGSADAGATLRALNRLYGLGLSNDELCNIGVKLGADVPFCVLQGCYLSEGIGEILTKLPGINETSALNNKKASIALIKPPIDVSTKYVYEHLDTEGVSIHPDVDAQTDAIKDGNLEKMSSLMRNVLRDVTVPAYPIVLELEEFLKDCGALGAMMSGSGPTVFGIFDDAEKCRQAVRRAKEIYPGMFSECAEFVK